VTGVVVYPRDVQTARPVVDVDATLIMNGVRPDRILSRAPAPIASPDCFTRFTGPAALTWAVGDPCLDMGPRGGTLSISGYWARVATGPKLAAAEPFMQILQAGVISNAGESAAAYLTQPSCADEINAHEMAHARGEGHSATMRGFLDRSCAQRSLSIQSQSGAPVRAAAGGREATITGSTFTIAWDAPPGGVPVTTYVIEAGSAPGLDNLANFATGGNSTSYLAMAVAPGTYYIRVRASNGGELSPASNEISVAVTAQTFAMPGAPTGLASTANGSTVTLTWNAAAGTTPTAYWIEAGSAPGIGDLASFSTGSAATSFTATDVGAGTYFVRVRAITAAGIGPASNEARLTVASGNSACSGAPSAPGALTASVSGSTVELVWDRSAGVPTSYVVEAGSSAGSSDLANFDTASTSTTLRAIGVGAGDYFVRMRARNACGVGEASNEVLVSVR
jgi:hypothetical protein